LNEPLNIGIRKTLAEVALAILPKSWGDELRLRRRFRREFLQFQSQADRKSRLSVLKEDIRRLLGDYVGLSDFDPHYFFHQAWAARVLAETKPASHVDLSSHLDFSAILSAFIPVKFYDYHAIALRLDNLETGRADLVRLPFAADSIPSLSCMHVIEHIGLGRYGDPLDVDGDLKAMAELRRVLAPGGALLIVVPVGRPRVVFNAHRIYSYAQILDALKGLTLKEFALIADDWRCGNLIRHAAPDLADRQEYGCGCFLFTKETLYCDSAIEQNCR